MARKRAPDRLENILEAATQAFITRGYRATRVDEIAADAEISSATVYLYASSKEALFALVLRRLFGHDVHSLASPYEIERGTSLVNLAVDYLRESASTPLLDRALAKENARATRDDFASIVRELYQLVFRHRRAITLIEKCGRDWPELQLLFRNDLRAKLLQKIERYLDQTRGIVVMPDTKTAARAILELIAWFAMHRFTAANTSAYDDAISEQTATTILVRAFTIEKNDKTSYQSVDARDRAERD
jgi:AcrR family transcriptional regulator